MVVERDGEYVVLELKYLTSELIGSANVFGQNINDAKLASNMYAINIRSYACWKDVHRIEVLKKYFNNVVGGLSIIVTNNKIYWQGVSSNTAGYKEFALTNNSLTSRHWSSQSNATKMAKSHAPFDVFKPYKYLDKDWEPVVCINNAVQGKINTSKEAGKSEFKYLIIEV